MTEISNVPSSYTLNYFSSKALVAPYRNKALQNRCMCSGDCGSYWYHCRLVLSGEHKKGRVQRYLSCALGSSGFFEFTTQSLRSERQLFQFPTKSIYSLVKSKTGFWWVAVGITALLMNLDVVAVDLLWIGGAKFVAKRHFGMLQVVRGMQVCCFFQCCAEKQGVTGIIRVSLNTHRRAFGMQP